MRLCRQTKLEALMLFLARCAWPLAIAVLGIETPAVANTLQVTSYGVDSSSCGLKSPCRSISQAMNNAESGDTIYVGPGTYGNVSGVANFAGPGDEQPNPGAGQTTLPDAVAPGCIVCIGKPLHIYSVLGAAATTIASPPNSPYGSTVMITSPGVDFGAPGQGFTLVGGGANGVTISLYFPVVQNLSIVGNIDNGDATGFGFYGYPLNPQCQYHDCTFTARILIANNQAIGNRTGFEVEPNFCCRDGGGPIILKDNLALGAGTGFEVVPGDHETDEAGPVNAGNVSLVNNVASGNGIGFSASDSGEIEYNTALNNSQVGFLINPGGAPFYGNSAISNGGPGVIIFLVDLNDTYFLPELTTSTLVPFAGNNFMDNDRNRPPFSVGPFGLSIGPSAHCGVLFGDFLANGYAGGPLQPEVIQLAAANNFWGSASGPSSSGSADLAGGVCDQSSDLVTVHTIAAPFAKTPFAVVTTQ